MKKLLIAALMAFAVVDPVVAATIPPPVLDSYGRRKEASVVICADLSGNLSPCATGSGTTASGSIVAGASFTRPADTTAYAVGDVVTNSTTAGSVVPLSIAAAGTNGGTGTIVNVRLSKSGTSITNASFRVHLFKTSPATTAGDNAVFAGAVGGIAAIEIGYYDVTLDEVFSDGAKGVAGPVSGRSVSVFEAACVGTLCVTGSTNIYALIEARGAYTPVSGETFTVALEIFRG